MAGETRKGKAMNEENTQKLYQDFPALYRDAKTGVEVNCMQSGFSCGDGWFSLIHQLSAEIEAEAHRLGLDPASDEWPRADQVKEKFGTLRFYVSTPSMPGSFGIEVRGPITSIRPLAGIESIRAMVQEAEARSATVCEYCGNPGTFRGERRIRTLCDRCEVAYQRNEL